MSSSVGSELSVAQNWSTDGVENLGCSPFNNFHPFSIILSNIFGLGAPNSVGGPDKNWRNRRSQKLDKMELLNLQSSLQSEIQAKQAISEDLSKTREALLAAQK